VGQPRLQGAAFAQPQFARRQQKNIHAHYDIGNAFYQLWLDPSMTYSSALFSEGASLEAAQEAKYRRIADQLQLPPGARVLEIGCGWGGFAETAARSYGAHVTGLTLSTEQLAYARQRLQARGWRPGRPAAVRLPRQRRPVRCHRLDRNVRGRGQSYWPGYFECVARNLKPGGRACIQTIVIADELFERYSKSTDFIQQYIFPGGMLPSPAEFAVPPRRRACAWKTPSASASITRKPCASGAPASWPSARRWKSRASTAVSC
jgi:cyclopropane-fatty-acyl-phospholipid synthase